MAGLTCILSDRNWLVATSVAVRSHPSIRNELVWFVFGMAGHSQQLLEAETTVALTEISHAQ
jgi:hypothetical protein